MPDNLKKRSAGVLLSVTSLPSAFGIGDMGPEAFSFAAFLHRSKQRYWQILPLTPVDEGQLYSPYSSLSSFAGNTLLISPEKLADEGLLKRTDLAASRLPDTDRVNYAGAARIKTELFNKAFFNFKKKSQQAFNTFCRKEAHWLNDFSLYVCLRAEFNNAPWYQWTAKFRKRDRETLRRFASQHRETLTKVKWLQFVFFRQWNALKSYGNQMNISILGDLPFYMSYDSADVWANAEIFKLNNDGSMAGVAGVPPDYFNEDGQRWGMPVYRWDVMQRKKFNWWINRIKKNLETCDILRLDHFRAFSSFWEVPAKSETAKTGTWKRAPGMKLFNLMKKELKSLPFVAEDLGDISEDVYELRDRFSLPGMKVLQFAFGKSMPESDHIPHNYLPNFFAYTGTHDNNTTRGWYKREIQKEARKQIAAYCGHAVNEKNVSAALLRLLYASVAKTVIVPAQDLLNLHEAARMNKPASTNDNWLWRLLPGQLGQQEEDRLIELTNTYGR